MPLYQGSRLLSPLADGLGLPLDQVNFMVGEILALFFSFLYRIYLSPRAVGPNVRHAVAAAVGFALGSFCYGRGFLHMLCQSGMCYLIMRFAPPNVMHKLVLVVAMLYMSVMHIYRMTYDYGGYVLDVTGPLMICTQKLTSMAFSVHDGIYKKQEKLNEDQKQQCIRKMPNLLQFSSFILYFQGLLVGPLCFYTDYMHFVEGTHFQQEKQPDNDKNSNSAQAKPKEEPSPLMVVIQKLAISIICLLAALLLAPYYSVTHLQEDEFLEASFPYKLYFIIFFIGFARAKYFFAWKLGEAINNASGLGFNGYDENGNAKWNIVTNVNIRKLESATSLKVLIDNWNVQSAVWLRRVCYERVPFQKTLMTYVLSAMWHGFYPGYYFTFMGASLFWPAMRAIRRNIRPWFQKSAELKLFYDIVTWFFAQLALAYLIVPFTLLEFWPCFYFYHYSMYWFLHIGVIIALLVLPAKGRSKPPTKDSKPQDPTAQDTIPVSSGEETLTPAQNKEKDV